MQRLPPTAAKLYRLLLLLYPRAIREEYGREMEAAFTDRWCHSRARTRVILRELRAAVRAAWIVRRKNRSPGTAAAKPRFNLMSDIMKQEFLQALRTIKRAPGFTAVAVLTLGLGIGANTAIFSVVDSVLLRELPYSDPHELVLVWNRLGKTGVEKLPNSAPEIVDYRERSTLFDGFAGVWSENTSITGYGNADRITLGSTTANFFDILGVEPHLGRFFVPGDDTPIDNSIFIDPSATIPPSVIILSYGFWQTKFGGDPDVVGRSLFVDGKPVNVVGVAPPGFDIYLPEASGVPMGIQAWIPLRFNLSEVPRDGHWLTVVARLSEGTTLAAAQAEMNGIAAQLRDEYAIHEEGGIELDLVSVKDDAVGHVAPLLIALLAAVGLVLLIACSNVANLMLLRVAGRTRELAVRLALGASWKRITALLAAESTVIGALSVVAGVAIASGGIRLLMAFEPDNVPRLEAVQIDGRVFAFAIAAALVSILIVTMVPVIRARRSSMLEGLREGARGTSSSQNRIRSALVVTQVAFTAVLLTGTGLMLRSFVLLGDIDPGFEPRNLVSVSASLPFFEFRDFNERGDFYERAIDEVREIPGVEAAGGTVVLPLAEGNGQWVTPYSLSPDGEDWNENRAAYRLVIPGYFEAMGTRILQGRAFERSDNRTRENPVAVIDRTLAEELYPGDDAVGNLVYIMQFGDDFTTVNRVPARIIGVAENVRHTSIYEDSRPTVYIPHRQWTDQRISVVVRTPLAAADIGGQVREIIQSMNPNVPVFAIRDMERFVARATSQTQFALTMGTVFAAVALVLASVGLFGLIAFSVRQRTREIGVRVAFGADRAEIVKLIVWQGFKLSGTGVLIGFGVSLLATRGLESQLYGVGTRDPIAFFGAGLLLVLVALAASYVPARNAAAVDPRVALAEE